MFERKFFSMLFAYQFKANTLDNFRFKITIFYFPKQATNCQKKILYPVMLSILNLNVPIDVFKHPDVSVSTSDANQTSML